MSRIIEVINPEENAEVAEDQETQDTQEELQVEEESSEETQEVEEKAEESPEPDEVTVTIGEEQPAEEENRAPEWVRELRKQHRDAQKRIRELEAQLPKTQQTALPAKPKLEDFDYDSDKFESALENWYEAKRKHEAQLEEQQRAIENEQKTWQQRLSEYASKKTELKVKDFDDAESFVQESMNVTQQGIILQGAENPALVVYALGKNPKKARELAEIKDPVKFAFQVAKLETQLKVQGKRTPPPPEKPVSGSSAPISGAVNSTLEQLRAEAERTGDYTKVMQYKRKLKDKKN